MEFPLRVWEKRRIFATSKVTDVKLKIRKGYKDEEDLHNADDGDDGTGLHIL